MATCRALFFCFFQISWYFLYRGKGIMIIKSSSVRMLKSSPCFVNVTNLVMQADLLYMLSVSWCEAQGSLLCSFMVVWASLVAQTVKNLPAVKEKVKVLVTQSCPTLCNPMDCIAHQALLSLEFSRQEYRSGLPCVPPGDLPEPGIEPVSPALHANSLPSEPPGSSAGDPGSVPGLG